MISIILINYYSSHFIKKTIGSLKAQNIPIEIIVLDNSENDLEANALKNEKNIRLIINEKNLGFAKACNIGFENASNEYILLINPDAYLFPNCLNKLVDFLNNNPNAAAVSPVVYWDEEKKFFLPPNPLPSTNNHLKNILSEIFPKYAKKLSINFRNYAYQAWCSDKPFLAHALSGGHVLLRKKAITNVGGLFDSQFFMYWEDSDLMLRFQQKGWQVWLLPQAEALHAYEHNPKKNQLMAENWPKFYKKHIRSRPLYHLMSRLLSKLPKHQIHFPFKQLTLDNTGLSGKVNLEYIGENWLLEISPSPLFISAIGHFGTGEWWHIPYNLASRFQHGQYYLRLGSAQFADNSSNWQYWCWQHTES